MVGKNFTLVLLTTLVCVVILKHNRLAGGPADRRLAEELSQPWMAEDELGAAEREMDRLRREVAESAGAFLWEFEGEVGCKLAMPSRFGRSRTRSGASLLQGWTTTRSSGAC